LDAYTSTLDGKKVTDEKEPTSKGFEPYEMFQDGEGMPEMIYLPDGTFNMGSKTKPEKEWGKETPQHAVSLDHFAIGKYLITVEQYMAFVKETQSHEPEWREKGGKYNIYTSANGLYKKKGDALCDADCPIIGISWNDAQAYCQWLSEKMKKDYHLLTEAQWEYACRAGSEMDWCFGDDEETLKDYAWFGENAESRPQPVGQKQANAWGLYDMHGNVWEWVQDWYGRYSHEPKTNPKGSKTGGSRVVRGGSWLNTACHCRSAIRLYDSPSVRYNYVGFRLARAI